MTMQRLTQQGIRRLLLSDDRAVERAILALYRRQTEDEKQSGTKHANGRGFNITHARTGSYCARWILSGKKLTGHWLIDCRDIALFYSRQLLEIAKERDLARSAHRATAA